jgi:hypothetical protein
VPGDTDISHAVEQRLVAIEARLDALDGGPPAAEVDQPDAGVGDPEPKEEETPSPYSSKSKRSS